MRFLYIISFLLISTGLSSQTFEEYYKQKHQEYDDYVNKSEEEYNKFIEERDKEFSKFLKKNWETFEMTRGKLYKQKPKPNQIPIYIDSLKEKYKIINFTAPVKESISLNPSILPVRQIESFTVYKRITTECTFYGESISIDHEDISFIKVPKEFDNKTIGNHWDKLNKIEFDNCIPQLLEIKKELNLNDWGYYLLVKNITKQIKPGREYYKLLTWYILLKSHYNVKIGYTNTTLLLLTPFTTNIYGVPYYNINNEIFYVFESENPGTIKSYVHIYPGADKIIEPEIKSAPVFSGLIQKKTLQYLYNNISNNIDVNINTNLKNFYNDYPLMDLQNYFNSAMSNETKKSLIQHIEPEILGKSEEEAVSYVLHFTQNAFPYKTDREQFGREKIYFPDELFMYEYSDCEDRAVLFAYLVKELLDLKVIGLDYDDHVAVAVKFNQNIKGNYIMWENDKYVVCDPTYINAPIGKILPKHIDSSAKLIHNIN